MNKQPTQNIEYRRGQAGYLYYRKPGQLNWAPVPAHCVRFSGRKCLVRAGGAKSWTELGRC